MANNLSNTAANAMINALTALLNNGRLELFTGTRPANANTALTTQTLLATLTFAATAFGSATAGVAVSNSIGNVTAAASGTAAWCRCYQSDGVTVVLDCNVGTSGSDLNLTTTTISFGGTVSVTSFTLTLPE